MFTAFPALEKAFAAGDDMPAHRLVDGAGVAGNATIRIGPNLAGSAAGKAEYDGENPQV